MGPDEVTAQACSTPVEELLAGDRGILAMDESIVTSNRRFAAAGIERETESRRAVPSRELQPDGPPR
jgi:fructose-bisphosphate aldolase class 1